MLRGNIASDSSVTTQADLASALVPIIYMIEDDESVRNALAWALRHVDAEIKTYSLPSEILRVVPMSVPSCLLVDFGLPEMDGLSLLKRLRGCGWELPFIVISGCGDIPVVVDAMRLGAIDFLEKPIDETVICRLAQDAIESDRKRIAVSNQHRVIAERLQRLTNREIDVLEGVVAGRLNKQIASELGIKVKTIETHRANLTRKLEVESVAQLVQMVIEHRRFIQKSTETQGNS